MTLGNDIGEKFRVFGKIGITGVRHSQGDFKDTKARATAGVGMLYKFTDNVALRADYDHYFKRSSDVDGVQDGKIKWKGANYLGAGIQYTF